MDKVQSVLTEVILVFSFYSESQRSQFSNHFITIAMQNPQSPNFSNLITVTTIIYEL